MLAIERELLETTLYCNVDCRRSKSVAIFLESSVVMLRTVCVDLFIDNRSASHTFSLKEVH